MKLTAENSAQQIKQYVKTIGDYPGSFEGRGIVTVAGGKKYSPCAWVLLRMLREAGCQLPIQCWFLGDRERDDDWIELVKQYDVECMDGLTLVSA